MRLVGDGPMTVDTLVGSPHPSFLLLEEGIKRLMSVCKATETVDGTGVLSEGIFSGDCSAPS